ncbi:hypothetical protein [Bradyrhizobium sp. JYMT SZCCT0180]|uniref:hypothetical protein n=1 Tax=Bradyrhizobium sp. JYMT SZCCT0180 TaxID=2807666 RepID=UPI001BA7A73E|nr:hypothetical protein [Bradyrhizobium sp. JYMT SZCCT0180]MBR1213972.1 hypothetical protein [Bradyrhizobium sp. JYMT SZCCT0180]
MGQSRLQSTQCRAFLTHDDIRLDAVQPEHFLGAEAFFKGYPHWVVDLARRLATVLGAIRAVHDQRGLCAGRRAAIDLNQGDTKERYSNIVHPLVSAFSSGGKMRIALPYAAIVWCIAVAVWIALGAAQ